MTANRIITDHEELDGVGSTTHAQIDGHIVNTPFLVLSGVSGPTPASARRVKLGTGLTLQDDGPSSDVTIRTETSAGFLSQEEADATITLVPDKKTMLVYGEFTLLGTATIELSGSASLVGIG